MSNNQPLTEAEYETCLDLLYLNLKKLAFSADYSVQLNKMNAITKKQIEQILEANNID